MDKQIECTIVERGNGYPEVGEYVSGTDGGLYVVKQVSGTIHTGQPGEGNFAHGMVEELDWSYASYASDVHTAKAVIA